jgi:hypothetical protein
MWNNRMCLYFDFWKIHYLHLPCEVSSFTVDSEPTAMAQPSFSFHSIVTFLSVLISYSFLRESVEHHSVFWTAILKLARHFCCIRQHQTRMLRAENTSVMLETGRGVEVRGNVSEIPAWYEFFVHSTSHSFPVYCACFYVLLINGFKLNLVLKFLFELKEWKLRFGSQRNFSWSPTCPDLWWPRSLYTEATNNFENFGKNREKRSGWHWSFQARDYFMSQSW